jgi:hypothetical protein
MVKQVITINTYNMIKRIILAVMFVVAVTGFPASAYAQKVDEVTLTVSGDGATKTEATEVALRSAIEQAFGVFVSANTTILDDELVKDEIATVSSGNIKKYEEIASVQLPNGNTSVTLQAVVSVSKLITYAQSKGSTAEFAGATFGLNMRLKELNKANEEKAIANMVTQLKALAPSMFDFKLTVGEPKIARGNSSAYAVELIVDVMFNPNTELANSLLLKTLSSLSLTATEVIEYTSLNIPYYSFFLGNYGIIDMGGYLRNVVDYKTKRPITESKFFIRSSKSVELLGDYINDDINEAIRNFKITDNMGNILNKDQIITAPWEFSEKKFNSAYWFSMTPSMPHDTGSHGYYSANIEHLFKNYLRKDGICYEIKLVLEIPKEDISKYSSFTISNKEQ